MGTQTIDITEVKTNQDNRMLTLITVFEELVMR